MRCRVTGVSPTSELEKALQAPAREKIQQDSDEAVFTRRALAVEKERAIKEDRKTHTISLIDEYLVEIYDELRGVSEGRVVGRLENDTCGACHLKLSAAEVARVIKQDPPRCIHCRAILVD